jgi:hypothetical protein
MAQKRSTNKAAIRSTAAASKVVNAADAAAAEVPVAKNPKRVRPPKAKPFSLNPQGDAADAARPHRRAGFDRESRRAAIQTAANNARAIPLGDELTRNAQRLVDSHTREVMAMKQKYPHVQAIQEQRPITLEEARARLAGQPKPKGTVTNAAPGAKPVKADTKATELNARAKSNKNIIGNDGIMKTFSELDN